MSAWDYGFSELPSLQKSSMIESGLMQIKSAVRGPGTMMLCALDRLEPYQREGIWHIDKRIKGYGRLCESTGVGEWDEAERYLRFRLTEIREASIYGVRPRRVFREAATKYLIDNQHMPSIADTAMHLSNSTRSSAMSPLGACTTRHCVLLFGLACGKAFQIAP